MASQILAQIHKAFETRTCEFLTFLGVAPTVSAGILENLLPQKDPIALSLRIHFIAPDGIEFRLWIGYDLLTPNTLVLISDTLSTYGTFVGTFANSKKTPDLCYSPRVDGVKSEFPTIVLEAGWSESQAQLERDCQLWFEGSAGAVKVVLLFKLFEPNIFNEIKATLNVCRVVAGAIVLDTLACSSLPYHIFISLTSY
ncbi:hypothetical protein HOY80DRAFT_1042247 [Tuber brumale]|nr:hypothetical protein HOY80DRAFT_1042247 [Tuber brumale]